MTPSGELSIACRHSSRWAAPADTPTKTNTVIESEYAFGVCAAAIIATLSALRCEAFAGRPTIACDDFIVRWAAKLVDVVLDKSALPPMSVSTPARAHRRDDRHGPPKSSADNRI